MRETPRALLLAALAALAAGCAAMGGARCGEGEVLVPVAAERAGDPLLGHFEG